MSGIQESHRRDAVGMETKCIREDKKKEWWNSFSVRILGMVLLGILLIAIVVRQMKYSTQGFDKDNELDLCILLNGLPIITLELKKIGRAHV